MNVLLADSNTPVNHCSLQSCDRQFAANFLTELPVAGAISNQRLLKLFHGHVVALSEFGHSPRQSLVINGDAPFLRLLELDVLNDQSLHDLVNQHIARRQLQVIFLN